LLSSVSQFFFGGFSSDANEYSGGQRAGDVDFVVARKPRSDFRDSDQLTFFGFSDERIDIQGLRDEHRASPQPFGHRRRDFDYL